MELGGISVCLLHGEDEFSIAQAIDEIQSGLGDRAMLDLNTTRLEGGRASLDELRSAALAMPFIAPRRLVIVTGLLARLSAETQRTQLMEILAAVPATNLVLLVEIARLKSDYWFLKGVEKYVPASKVLPFRPPNYKTMPGWIQTHAKKMRMRITPAGAGALSSLVGEDTRSAHQELEKLYAYVGNARPVEAEDVEAVCVSIVPTRMYALTDAVINKDRRGASLSLRGLLEDNVPIMILQSIVATIRQLLLSKEILAAGGTAQDIRKACKINNDYVLDKVVNQSRRVDMAELEQNFRDLLSLDLAIKSGEVEGEPGLELWVAAATTRRS